jgi:hypothetical protein
MILLKMSRDLQVSFGAVTHLAEGLLSYFFSSLEWGEIDSGTNWPYYSSPG